MFYLKVRPDVRAVESPPPVLISAIVGLLRVIAVPLNKDTPTSHPMVWDSASHYLSNDPLPERQRGRQELIWPLTSSLRRALA